METFGERLRSARKEAKLTQETVHKRTGIAQATLSELESGRADSSGYTPQLAHLYAVHSLWLATGRVTGTWIADD